MVNLYKKISIIGIIAPPEFNLNDVKNISKEDLKDIDYDLILVTGPKASLAPILKEAETLGIDENKVVLDRTLGIPNFTLEKYNKLRRSKLSILSMNCFGGIIYYVLGLPFLSPTINMFTSDEGFLNFLKNPMKNVEKELVFKEFKPNLTAKFDYPIFMIGDTQWDMLHYNNKNVAIQKWQERCSRINWFNILAVMYTENPKILAEFDKLPFAKKVCLVNFESDLDSAFYVAPEFFNGDPWKMIYGWEHSIYYDFWDMLLYGKKTPLTIQK